MLGVAISDPYGEVSEYPKSSATMIKKLGRVMQKSARKKYRNF
jgi:hypothetical protein